MSATYDPATPAGRVRLLVNDVDPITPTFDDEEIAAFLDLGDGDTRLAAATALETIAANEVLVQKRIRLLDKQTDGPAESKELRELAASLRAQADADYSVDIAHQVHTQFAYRDLMVKRRGAP